MCQTIRTHVITEYVSTKSDTYNHRIALGPCAVGPGPRPWPWALDPWALVPGPWALGPGPICNHFLEMIAIMKNNGNRFKGGDDLIFSAVALYAVRGVVHKLRAQSRRASNVQKHLWEQVRIAARYSGSLRKKLESLWVSN